jgi:filamentous hemagglutinin family protein
MQRQILALAPLLALGFAIVPVKAQIVPSAPNTPGATGTMVTPGISIDITGGQTVGTNLFHSFSQFGIPQGQVANFQTAAEIKNVLARVNGGDPSVIDGLLRLTGSTASLYLMNPAGIIFGNNAKVNIPGSFVTTTATSIGIGSGMFNAIGPNTYTSDTPGSFVFQPGARGVIINSARNISDVASILPDYNLPSMGEKRTLAFIGNTVLNLADISTTKENIALFTVPDNALLTFIGRQDLIGLVDYNTIVKPNPGETIMNLPTFNAFNIPTLADLTTLSRQNDLLNSSQIKAIGNNQVTLDDKNSTIINPGDLYSKGLAISDFGPTVPADIGSIALLSGQDITIGGGLWAANDVSITGKTIQVIGNGYFDSMSFLFNGVIGKRVQLFAQGDINIPADINARSFLRISTAGDVRVGNLRATMPEGTARSSTGGDIDIRANTLQVTNARSSVFGIENDPPLSAEASSKPYTEMLGRFSILASGAISIEQTGNGQFIEAAGLERDPSGSIVYRLASNPDTRVTIAGVNIPTSETLFVYQDGILGNWLRDAVTGNLITPYDGSNLVLKNVTTGELIQGDRVIIRPSNNPASLNGGGTQGLIGRLDKSSGLLVELSGTTKPTLPTPLDSQHPAMISITSKTGSTSLANPIGGALPGSYSNVPGLASVVTLPLVTPTASPQIAIPSTPEPVLSSAAIAPSPITQLPTETTPTATKATPAPTQSEIVLYHRPVLSSNATRATLDTGILKVEIDPREEGILTLYRQPIGAPTIQQTSQPTAQKEEPKN